MIFYENELINLTSSILGELCGSWKWQHKRQEVLDDNLRDLSYRKPLPSSHSPTITLNLAIQDFLDDLRWGKQVCSAYFLSGDILI